MSGKLSRWLRSKTGTRTLIGVVAVLAVVIIVGAALGWWADLIDLLSGTVAPPPPSFPPPTGGYTCIPSCADGVTDYDGDGTPEPQDAKFLSMPGEQMASFGGESIIVWIAVPGDYETFELGFFDGDSAKDNAGNLNMWGGNWDNTKTQSTYTLYSDPLKDGRTPGEIEIGKWYGNDANATSGPYCTASAATMPNNDWYTVTCQNADEARGPSGHYFYRLEMTRPVAGTGINAVKLRSNGYLSTGQGELVDASFAFVGMVATYSDWEIIYPEHASDWSNFGPSTYDGTWDFYFYVPPAEYPTRTVTIEIWDGDFDRGTARELDNDTDDDNTEGIPSWASSFAVAERAGGQGAPADDYGNPLYKRPPAVKYTITDPDGVPIYTNEEPSGTEEWERFVLTTDPDLMDPSLPPNQRADKLVDELDPGWYGWRIEGLDIHNTVWIRFNFDMVTEPPPPPCDATCPRTIGYWKNNVKKVLEGRTSGVQETQESLETGLMIVAQESGFYCNGMDLTHPVEMSPCYPLTLEEANTILQRSTSGKVDYPGGKEQAQTMLARALQQNLATWLNMGTGKICKDTVVTLEPAGGRFEGTLWKALLEAKDIILNEQGDDARMERAKDIGDLINNGLLGEDAPANTECNVDDYDDTVPPDLQPPKDKDKPKAPKPDKPPKYEPDCTGDQCPVCAGNPCDSIFSPGYWKNYTNHYTDEEFLALIQKTMHYSGLSIDEALAILDDESDQYHRHLLSAELNVAADPGLEVSFYNSDNVGGLVLDVLDQAYITDPADADADLTDAVLYLGAEGEGQGDCRVSCPE